MAYESTEGIAGEYMVCVLFHGYIVLSRHCDDYRKLQVLACIYVLDMKVDTLTNGRGKYIFLFLYTIYTYISQGFSVTVVGFLGK